MDSARGHWTPPLHFPHTAVADALCPAVADAMAEMAHVVQARKVFERQMIRDIKTYDLSIGSGADAQAPCRRPHPHCGQLAAGGLDPPVRLWRFTGA